MPDPGSIRTVLFDFDGVLADSEPSWDRADAQVVAEAGGRFRPETKPLLMGLGPDDSIRRLAELHGLSVPAATLRERRERIMEACYRHDIGLLPGAAEVVGELARRGFRLGIGTATPARLVRLLLQRFGLETPFAALVTAEDVGRGKPAPDIFLRAAELLGSPPDACAVVEDSRAGVEAAVAAGMRAVWLRNPHAAGAERLAHVTLERLVDLPELLRPA